MTGLPKILQRGQGPNILLLHGSATDSGTWFLQFSSLASQLHMVAFDRPLMATVEAQADMAARVIESVGGEFRVCGSSFGGVIALDLARRYPDHVHSLMLCEPPLSTSDECSAVPVGFGCHFDRLVATEGGETAAAFFLKTVLTTSVYNAMPDNFRKRAVSLWPSIRSDSVALAQFKPSFSTLDQIRVPVVLVGGENSPPRYADVLETLHCHLPSSRIVTIKDAGHMMHIENPQAFGKVLTEV